MAAAARRDERRSVTLGELGRDVLVITRAGTAKRVVEAVRRFARPHAASRRR